MACRRHIARSLLVACWFALTAGVHAASLPSWEDVVGETQLHIRTLDDYRRGDILTREDANPLFDRFEKLGWKVATREQILGAMPAESDFVVRSLQTQDGKRFMRSISGYPSAYDRLYRLEKLPNGQQTIRDLIDGPGGSKMIRYLTTTSGGKEMGKMLENTPQGKSFNKDTGKIFTATQLLHRLKKVYHDAKS